jgi:GT2 family glycosyltransferase
MPSRIENSTLAVYEAAYYGIPCIASDRGGTPELIAPEHREQVLTDPHPAALADKLEEALYKGGFVPRPSFKNDQNLSVWLKFHGAMGAHVQDLEQKGEEKGKSTLPKVSICVVAEDDNEYFEELVTAIEDQMDGECAEFVMVTNVNSPKKTLRRLENIQRKQGASCIIEQCEDLGEQRAQNTAALKANGELLVFLKTGTLLKPDYIKVLRRAAASSDADIFGCFYERVRQVDDIKKEGGTQCVVFTGDHSNAFFRQDYMSPVVAIRRQAFQELGGFSEDYMIPGAANELVSNAQLRNFSVETIPVSIAWYVEEYAVRKRLNLKAERYRSIRPFLDMAPHCYKRILMSAQGASGGESTGGDGGMNAIRDPISSLEEQAREAADEAGDSPKFWRLGWKIYFFNIRVFLKVVSFQAVVFKRLVRLKKKISRR